MKTEKMNVNGIEIVWSCANEKKLYNIQTRKNVAKAVLAGRFNTMAEASEVTGIHFTTIYSWIRDYKAGNFDVVEQQAVAIMRQPKHKKVVNPVDRKLEEVEKQISEFEQKIADLRKQQVEIQNVKNLTRIAENLGLKITVE